jgi:hypothetical protein
MVDRLHDLETLVIVAEPNEHSSYCHQPEEWFSTPYPRLTSLTLLNLSLKMEEIQSVLLYTPALTYLKTTGTDRCMFDGSRWEEFIKTKLPSLNNFLFYELSPQRLSDGESGETALNRMITSFRTPFWTHEKRWWVVCTWHLTGEVAEIYTSSLSTLTGAVCQAQEPITRSNFDRQCQDRLSVNRRTTDLPEERVSQIKTDINIE